MTHDRADGAMRPLRMINAHAEGEIGFVAIDGVPDVPGHSLAAKLDHPSTGWMGGCAASWHWHRAAIRRRR